VALGTTGVAAAGAGAGLRVIFHALRAAGLTAALAAIGPAVASGDEFETLGATVVTGAPALSVDTSVAQWADRVRGADTLPRGVQAKVRRTLSRKASPAAARRRGHEESRDRQPNPAEPEPTGRVAAPRVADLQGSQETRKP
jgi:hypothetical protein